MKTKKVRKPQREKKKIKEPTLAQKLKDTDYCVIANTFEQAVLWEKYHGEVSDWKWESEYDQDKTVGRVTVPRDKKLHDKDVKLKLRWGILDGHRILFLHQDWISDWDQSQIWLYANCGAYAHGRACAASTFGACLGYVKTRVRFMARSRTFREHVPNAQDMAGPLNTIRCFDCGEVGVRASVTDDVVWKRPCTGRKRNAYATKVCRELYLADMKGRGIPNGG